MSKRARGLFDEQVRLEKLSKKQDPLERLAGKIDFEFFRNPLEAYFLKDTDRSKGGRPSYDYVLMFKILILQRYYNLSDDSIEYAILDRLSFMRFLGLGINDTVPDAKTIWLFRDKLSSGNMINQLFELLDKKLDKDGIVIHKGSIVDATIVEVPIQRNSKEENAEIKNGTIPENWSEEKTRQKDTDAKWVRKRNKNFFGYKNHIKADIGTKLITRYAVTSANIPDKDVLEQLISQEEDGDKELYADSAYRSEAIELGCMDKKIISCIHEKGYKNKKITEAQTRSNHLKSKIRVRVEHIFAFMTNTMNEIYLKYRNMKTNAAGIGLMNITYNLFRLVQLNKCLAK